MLHKLRTVADQTFKNPLRGDDETYVRGVDVGAPGRSRGKKSRVVVACEALPNDNDRTGRGDPHRRVCELLREGQ